MSRRKKKRNSKNSQKVSTPKSGFKHQIKVEQDFICPICGKEGCDCSMDIHHKKARSKGGGNNRENLVAWHKTGHRRYHQEHGTQTSDDYGNPI